MNPLEIHNQAEAAEKLAESGDKSALADQFKNLSQSERVAVAKELQKINQERLKKDDSLPQIDISTATDAAGNEVLLDVTDRAQRGKYNPWRYIRDTHDSGTSVYHGELQKLDDGSTLLVELDPTTGKPRSSDKIASSGRIQHKEFDRLTNTLTSNELMLPDGSITHTDYDPATGKKKSLDIFLSNGDILHSEYDQSTGKRILLDLDSASGEFTHSDWDPETGRILD